MEKIIAAVDKMKPFFEKVSNNPYLRAIRDGFVSCLPVILFSSLFILVACIPEIWDFKWDDYVSGLWGNAANIPRRYPPHPRDVCGQGSAH